MSKLSKPKTGSVLPRTNGRKGTHENPVPLTQRDKFIRAAREAGCDETGEALDEALRKIARAGTGKRPSS